MYDQNHIIALIDTAHDLELKGHELLWTLSLAQIMEAYNGIGAEWMSESLRDRITRHWALFEPAALIHDCMYVYLKDRSSDSRTLSDTQFFQNCKFLAKKNHSWYSPKRYLRLNDARILYNTLRIAGNKAWEEGPSAAVTTVGL